MATESTNDPSGKFIKINQVHASYHDFVCYLAYEQATGLQVFWYEFLNENLSPEKRQSAFQRLSQVKNISSQYILNILDVWQTNNPPRFVVITEATQNPSLSEYMKTIVKPPVPKVIKWFKQIALSVQALHKSPQQIVHGRLSMNTITLKASTGAIKVRLSLTDISNRTISPSSLNIDIYKAPERIRGVISPANDIWSLGIILTELLGNGVRPYDECQTPFDLIRAISQHKHPDSLAAIKGTPAFDLISKCLQPEMFRISIDEVLAHPALQEIVSPQPPLTTQPGIQILVANNNQPQENTKTLTNSLLDL